MSGPAAEALHKKIKKIADELNDLEAKIYNAETEYIAQAECTAFGTVLKGFGEFVTSKSAQAKNKARTFRVEDRAFSLSSYTSSATRELQGQTQMFEDAQQYGRNAQYAVKGMQNSLPVKRGDY